MKYCLILIVTTCENPAGHSAGSSRSLALTLTHHRSRRRDLGKRKSDDASLVPGGNSSLPCGVGILMLSAEVSKALQVVQLFECFQEDGMKLKRSHQALPPAQAWRMCPQGPTVECPCTCARRWLSPHAAPELNSKNPLQTVEVPLATKGLQAPWSAGLQSCPQWGRYRRAQIKP